MLISRFPKNKQKTTMYKKASAVIVVIETILKIKSYTEWDEFLFTSQNTNCVNPTLSN